jgi:hypothetical protein
VQRTRLRVSLTSRTFGEMSASTSKLLHAAQDVASFLSVLLSLLLGVLAQASSADYRGLLLGILPFAAANAVLVSFVCLSKERRRIWLVCIPVVLGFASYFEMACRVIFGFRIV